MKVVTVMIRCHLLCCASSVKLALCQAQSVHSSMVPGQLLLPMRSSDQTIISYCFIFFYIFVYSLMFKLLKVYILYTIKLELGIFVCFYLDRFIFFPSHSFNIIQIWPWIFFHPTDIRNYVKLKKYRIVCWAVDFFLVLWKKYILYDFCLSNLFLIDIVFWNFGLCVFFYFLMNLLILLCWDIVIKL